MIEKRLKRTLGIISGIMFLGLVSYALILLLMNKNLNFHEIAYDTALVNRRHGLRSFAEGIIALCGNIYIIGHIIALYPYTKSPDFPIRKITGYFIVQVTAMFVCVLPFAAFDRSFFGDYVFPIWTLSGTLALVLVGFSVVRRFRKIKYRQ